MSAVAAILFPQLLAQAPTLLAALVGGVLALVFWSRHTSACQFLLAGCLVYALASVGGSVASSFLIAQANDAGGRAQIGTPVASVGIVAGLVRAAGIGLLIAAALVGRDQRL
ncbi:MAG: hypothetical protein ABI843_04080 [Dokdonella sp.]